MRVLLGVGGMRRQDCGSGTGQLYSRLLGLPTGLLSVSAQRQKVVDPVERAVVSGGQAQASSVEEE
jgi:hypothetical protein